MADDRVPEGFSDSGECHQVKLDFIVSNYQIDWDKVDVPAMVRSIATMIALRVADAELEEIKANPVQIAPFNFTIDKKKLFTDQDLQDLLRE